jgi:hypothetical protein
MKVWVALLAVVLAALLVLHGREAERDIYRELVRARAGAGRQ